MSDEAAEEVQDLAAAAEGAGVAAKSSQAPVIVIRNSISANPAQSQAGVAAPYQKKGKGGFNPCCCFDACCGLKIVCIIVAVFEAILAVPWFWAHAHILVLKSGLDFNDSDFNFTKHDHFKTVVDKDDGYFGKIGVGLRDIIGDENTKAVKNDFEMARTWGGITGSLLVISAILVLASIIFGLVIGILKIKTLDLVPRIGSYVSTGFILLHVLSMILTIVLLAVLCLKVEDYYDETQAKFKAGKITRGAAGAGIFDNWADGGRDFEDGGPDLKTSATKFDDVRDKRIIVYGAMGMLGLLDTTVCLYLGVCIFALSGTFKSEY